MAGEDLILTGFTIRKVGEADYHAVCLLEQGSAGSRYQAAVFVRQAMVIWPESFFVAVFEENPIGYLICAAGSPDPESGWILRVRVAEAMHRRGVGTAMMHKAHEFLMKTGVQKALLSCSPANCGALALYERLGYQVINHERGYFGHEEDRYILLKDLRDQDSERESCR